MRPSQGTPSPQAQKQPPRPTGLEMFACELSRSTVLTVYQRLLRPGSPHHVFDIPTVEGRRVRNPIPCIFSCLSWTSLRRPDLRSIRRLRIRVGKKELPAVMALTPHARKSLVVLSLHVVACLADVLKLMVLLPVRVPAISDVSLTALQE